MEKILGFQLKKPGFWELTRAVGVATLMWVVLVLVGMAGDTRSGSFANLAALAWGSVLHVVGADFRTIRQFGVLIGGCALISVLYHLIQFLF